MSLIKCSECGKEFSDQAKVCPNCACPIKRKIKCSECGKEFLEGVRSCPKCGNPIKFKLSFNLNKWFVLAFIGVVVIVILLCIILSGNNKLVCKWKVSNDVADVNNVIKYTFDNGKIKKVSASIYTKPRDGEIAEYLWSVTNNNQDQYNYYEGVSFKATFSESKAITVKYTIDVTKAPNMFGAMSSLDGVSGIDADSTKEEIKEIYEEADYVCK